MRKTAYRLVITISILTLWTGLAWAVDSQEWIYDRTYPTAQALWGVKFISPSEGWVVGSSGTILHTVDGGINWEAQESGTGAELKTVAFVNDHTGWVVGQGGTILWTRDGGRHWTAVPSTAQRLQQKGPIILGSGSHSTLLKVFFLNEQEGWTGGEDGFILHTRDGGEHWDEVPRFTYAPIIGIHFTDAQTGWMLGGDHQVYRTVDGGKKWLLATLTEPPHPETVLSSDDVLSWEGELSFLDKDRGWAVNGWHALWRTEDGGKSWVGTYLENSTTTLAFTGNMKGCVGGRSILCSEDGGRTWAVGLGGGRNGRNVIEGTLINVQGMSFVDAQTGWAVGGTGSLGDSDMQILKTEDGGKSWRMLSRQSYGTYFIDAKVGWKSLYDPAQDKSRIVGTDDGGNTWKIQKEFEYRIRLEEFFFINATTGWAVGARMGEVRGGGSMVVGDLIFHTDDGGKSWVTQYDELAGKYTDLFDGLQDVYFINPQVGWVAGSGGRIFHTTDGGKYWVRQKTPTSDFSLNKIRFVDARHGWVAGMKFNDSATEFIDNPDATGIVLHTENGGKDWKVQWKKRVDYMWLVGLHFMDDKNGWVAGQTTEFGGTCLVLRTTDGGKTWKEKELTGIDPRGLHVLDQNRAAVITEDNHVVLTRDGGKTWTEQLLSPRRYSWHFSEIFTSKAVQ